MLIPGAGPGEASAFLEGKEEPGQEEHPGQRMFKSLVDVHVVCNFNPQDMRENKEKNTTAASK